MARAINPKALPHYLLLRCLGAGGRGFSPGEAVRALRRLEAEGQLKDIVSRTGDRLIQLGLVELAGKRWLASDQGRQRARGFLAFPEGDETGTWAQISSRRLVPKLLGLPSPDEGQARRISLASGLRAAILNKAYKLGLDPYPQLTELRSALAWRKFSEALEFAEAPKGKKFPPGLVLDVVLSSVLGTKELSKSGEVLAQLAARIVGSPRTTPAALREALLRRWLFLPEPSSASQAPDGFDLQAFATEVIAAANACEEGRFGRAKVFLAYVYRSYRARNPKGLDRAHFDQALLQAHKTQLLTLSRADLVDAMNPDDVASSLVVDGAATFHFLRLG